jgi:hypothetical protein
VATEAPGTSGTAGILGIVEVLNLELGVSPCG